MRLRSPEQFVKRQSLCLAACLCLSVTQPIFADDAQRPLTNQSLGAQSIAGQSQAKQPQSSQAVSPTNEKFSSWPYRWRVGNFHILSTVDERYLRPVSEQLGALPPQIENTLGVTLQSSDVKLVVLANQAEFESYLKTHFPSLPNRRALYVQKRGMGVVITYLHKDWLVDARHECTHALLHQSGIHLPLWLDEGLAEYFENTSPDPRYHPDHRPAIQTQLRYGQIAQIGDLEDGDPTTLDGKGYKDAWGVVTFLLHHNHETRTGLSNYINDLHRGTAAGYLSRRLSQPIRRNWRHHYEAFFAQH